MDSSDAAVEHLSLGIIWWGGVILLAIGLGKCLLYAIGISRPQWFARIRSETLQRFLTGKGSRMVFGWGGFITAAIGGLFMLAAKGMEWLAEQVRL